MPENDTRDRRLELQDIFCDILGSDNVHFQPPNNIKMNYPAVIYKLSDIKPTYADDGVYLLAPRYMATFISKEPDSGIVFKMAGIKTARFVRHYVDENLYHYVYEVY